MAVTINKVDLTIQNDQLALLQARAYANKYTPVPNVKLPAVLRTGLNEIYKVLTGQELPLDGNTLAVAARDGAFYRLYVPKLYKDADGLYIRWGEAEIRLSTATDALTLAEVFDADAKVTFAFTSFNVSGKGNDPALNIKVRKGSTIYDTTIAVAAEDWKAYDAEVFNVTLDVNPANLVELIAEAGGTGTSGSTQGETTSRKELLTAMFGSPEEQTREVELTVTGYRKVDASYGTTFVLQCAPCTDAEVTRVAPYTATEFGIWAEGNVRNILMSEPAVSVDAPAKLVFMPGRRPVLLLPETVAAEGDLDLNF